ncbi:NAD(P)-binding protein [Flagelloscypha sp. PMI_526]|nr:NAD(P)-binding protein [Flagelloscypha sp. PMI_526]
MATVAAIQRKFLSSAHFAVVGASKDQTKFGTKVLKWYQDRSFDVTPLHPTESELEGIQTVKSISDLPNPTETSISIIVRPSITLDILKTSKELGIRSFWLQPGAEDETVISYIKENGLDAIWGGPCILVQGDGIVKGLANL